MRSSKNGTDSACHSSARKFGVAPPFEQSADLLIIGRKNIHRFALEQFAEVVALVMVLARGDGRGGGFGYAAHGVGVFRRNGVFQPEQVERLAGACQLD